MSQCGSRIKLFNDLKCAVDKVVVSAKQLEYSMIKSNQDLKPRMELNLRDVGVRSVCLSVGAQMFIFLYS